MKVKAKHMGYYNHRRRKPDEVFELIDDKAFSEKWMEKVDEESQLETPKLEKVEVLQSSSDEVI